MPNLPPETLIPIYFHPIFVYLCLYIYIGCQVQSMTDKSKKYQERAIAGAVVAGVAGVSYMLFKAWKGKPTETETEAPVTVDADSAPKSKKKKKEKKDLARVSAEQEATRLRLLREEEERVRRVAEENAAYEVAVARAAEEAIEKKAEELNPGARAKCDDLAVDDAEEASASSRKRKATVLAPTPGHEQVTWACRVCTFLNHSALLQCEMCDTKRI